MKALVALALVLVGCGSVDGIAISDRFSAEDQATVVEAAILWEEALDTDLNVRIVDDEREANVRHSSEAPRRIRRAMGWHTGVTVNGETTYLRSNPYPQVAAHEIGHLLSVPHLDGDDPSTTDDDDPLMRSGANTKPVISQWAACEACQSVECGPQNICDNPELALPVLHMNAYN
jgi:hypothetical protein